MGVVLGEDPCLPIRLYWETCDQDDPDKIYASLQDLGVDLEFLLEHEFEPDEPTPIFLDSIGRRFRIIVMALEVVLCVQVPADFDRRQLTIRQINTNGRELVVELLGERIHRALWGMQGEPGQRWTLAAGSEVEVMYRTHRENLEISLTTWLDFNEAWLGLVDPSLPIQIRFPFSRLFWRRR